ncbi:hypothetical protein ACJZ2D_015396 [Fusarium nematophilum]
MESTLDPGTVRFTAPKPRPEHLMLELPRGKTLRHDKTSESNHEVLDGHILRITSEFRVILPPRQDHDELVTIQMLGKSAEGRESWQTAIQGLRSHIFTICQLLRDGDKSTRNGVICHALGEEMNFWGECEQCSDDSLLGGCRKFQDRFHGACSKCLLDGRQGLCTARAMDSDEEQDYQPSESSDDQDKHRTTKKRKRRTQKFKSKMGIVRKQTKRRKA